MLVAASFCDDEADAADSEEITGLEDEPRFGLTNDPGALLLFPHELLGDDARDRLGENEGGGISQYLDDGGGTAGGVVIDDSTLGCVNP